MITCGPNKPLPPEAKAFLWRGCMIFAVCVLLVMTLCGITVAVAVSAPNETDCTSVAHAALATQYSGVNIRPDPNTGRPPIGSVGDRTPRPLQELTTPLAVSTPQWGRICDSGWVNLKYFSVTLVPTTRPTSTPAATDTPATPATPAPSPTRMSGTPPDSIWLCWRGVCYECPRPCTVEVRDRP